MCNCIEEAEKTANDLMNEIVEKRGNAVVTERAVITTRAIIFGEGARGWRLFAPVEGRYMQGKKVNKFETRLLFSFCPFCGESLTDKK